MPILLVLKLDCTNQRAQLLEIAEPSDCKAKLQRLIQMLKKKKKKEKRKREREREREREKKLIGAVIYKNVISVPRGW